MALFGASVANEDHAQRACHVALSIQKAIEEYGEKVKKDCGVEVKGKEEPQEAYRLLRTSGVDI